MITVVAEVRTRASSVRKGKEEKQRVGLWKEEEGLWKKVLIMRLLLVSFFFLAKKGLDRAVAFSIHLFNLYTRSLLFLFASLRLV